MKNSGEQHDKDSQESGKISGLVKSKVKTTGDKKNQGV